MQELGPVLGPDLPGFGAEPPLPPGGRRAEDVADWIARWLALRGHRRARVVGYSLGGSLALLLALRHPERVETLALCCCSPCWGRAPVPRLTSPLLRFGPTAAAVVEGFQLSVRFAFWRGRGRPEDATTVADMVARAHRPTMVDLCRSLSALDLRPRLPRLGAPTLVVGGTRDWLAPAAHARAMAGAVPGAKLRIFEGASHILCLTRQREFSATLADFLSRGDPQARRTPHAAA